MSMLRSAFNFKPPCQLLLPPFGPGVTLFLAAIVNNSYAKKRHRVWIWTRTRLGIVVTLLFTSLCVGLHTDNLNSGSTLITNNLGQRVYEIVTDGLSLLTGIPCESEKYCKHTEK